MATDELGQVLVVLMDVVILAALSALGWLAIIGLAVIFITLVEYIDGNIE